MQEIVETIHKETQLIDPITQESVHRDLGAFVLVISSHGGRGSIVGVDRKHIDLADIFNLLSPKNFPAMTGKPKVVIIQACAGGEWRQHSLLPARVQNLFTLQSIIITLLFRICENTLGFVSG